MKSKIYYENIPLTQYCAENNINYGTIKTKMAYYRKKNPNLDTDVAVKKAIESYGKQESYFVNKIPLTKYCKENNLEYATIVARIKKLKNEGQVTDDIIQEAIEKETKVIKKYYYNNESLFSYCNNHNISYNSTTAMIRSLKNNDPNLADDEAVEKALSKQKNAKYKYSYNNTSLKQFCINNGICYNTILRRIHNIEKEDGSLTCDEVVKKALSSEIRTAIKYYFNKDYTLRKHCKNSKINYYSIISRIDKLKADSPKLTNDELVQKALEYEIKSSINYYYENTTLKRYCEDKNISYDTIIKRIKKLKSEFPFFKNNELIEMALSYETKRNIKYYYDDVTLATYCKINDLSYESIIQVIKRRLDKNINLSSQEAIEQAVKQNEKNKYFKNLKNLMKNIKNGSYDKSDIKNICLTLKISYDNLTELMNKNYSFAEAIYIIWFFYDVEISKMKAISNDKLKQIYLSIENIETLKTPDLFKIYKCNLADTRFMIIKNYESYIQYIILQYFRKVNLKYNKDKFEDVYNELVSMLLHVIESCYSNIDGEIISYFNAAINSHLKIYVKKISKYITNDISLDQPISTDSNTSLYNFIEGANDDDIKQIVETDTLNDFSDKMSKILCELNKEELIFIKLKYVMQYNNEQISKILKISIEEVDVIEKRLLKQLSENPKIKVLIKKYY